MTARSGRHSLVLALALAAPAQAQTADPAAGIAEAFEVFAERCPQALADPEGYLAQIGTDPADARVTGATPDGTLRMVLPPDMELAEHVQIFDWGGVQWRECSTGYWSMASGAEDGLLRAFEAYIDGRPDLSVVAGGEIVMAGDAAGDLTDGQRSWHFVLSGADLPPGTVMAVTIGPQFLELDGELFLPKADADE